MLPQKTLFLPDFSLTEVTGICWSSKGQHLAIARKLGSITVLYKLQRHTFSTPCVNLVCFNPSDDTLACGGPREVQFWRDNQLIENNPVLGTVLQVAYSALGVYFAMLIEHNNEYRVAVRMPSDTVEIPYVEQVHLIAWGLDDVFCVGSSTGDVVLYKVDSVENTVYELYSLKASVGAVRCVCWAPGYIFAGGDEGVVSVWDTESLACVRVFAEADWCVTGLDVCKTVLAVSYGDKEDSRFFDYVLGTALGTAEGSIGSESTPPRLAFRPEKGLYVHNTKDGKLMLCGDFLGLIRR